MPAKDGINLLPKNEFKDSTLGKFIQWATSIGRWIVVFTEFIVICAFLSRFYFDTELANLFDKIRQNKAIVRSALVFEENFLRTQNKIKATKEILAQESYPSAIIVAVSKLLPAEVYLTEISVSDGSLKLSGFSSSESGVNLFVSGLKSRSSFSEVAVSQLNQKNAFSPINFDVSAKIQSNSK